MKRGQKKMLVLAMMTAFVATALFLPGLLCAGNLEPSVPPGPTMHTLDEVYDKLEVIDGKFDSAPAVPCDAAPVEKTGQTSTYGPNDDGTLEKGVAWPDPRFTDYPDGTVTDNLTGLVWLRNANCFATRMVWDDALAVCNNLADGQCGLMDGSEPGDWRLPNVKELQSLIDFGQYDPALPSGHPFSGVQFYYWSSTTDADDTSGAWFVSLYDGIVYNDSKTINGHFVWPVRGGQ